MERVLLAQLHNHTGKVVSVVGWVETRRDHGKLVFIDIRDRTGVLQTVATPQHQETHRRVQLLRPEWVLRMVGEVKQRPQHMRNASSPLGDIEMEVHEIEILSQAKELPFDKEAALNLDTYLDHLPLTLRSQKAREIFNVQATAVEAFRSKLREQHFVEFQSPAIVGADAEGGATAFTLDYYYEQKAHLATSPQLYKQIMVGVYERVFTTPKIFRAEKHATTRHLPEYTSLDFEMGFIKDHADIMEMLASVMRHIVEQVGPENISGSLLLPERIPTLTLREVQRMLGIKEAPDLEPEHERAVCEWAAREHASDFVFVTHYPVTKRPFYTYEDEESPGYTKSFDLLCRGIEITTGGQRIHDHDTLVKKIRERGLDPATFSYYLQAFRYGMPPHGGCATGLERLTARLLNLHNVREATLFPRDLNRIDTLLSE